MQHDDLALDLGGIEGQVYLRGLHLKRRGQFGRYQDFRGGGIGGLGRRHVDLGHQEPKRHEQADREQIVAEEGDNIGKARKAAVPLLLQPGLRDICRPCAL